MSVTSFGYVCFCAVSVVLFYALPKIMRPYALLAFSLIFYCFAGAGGLVYVLATAVCTYASALTLNRLSKKTHRKLVVALCCVICLGILLFVKYWGNIQEYFLPDTIDLNILVPLGISFYTFQAIGYVVDVYRKKTPAQKNFAKYLLFVCYFPQMTQGPIARYDALSPQLFEARPFNSDNLVSGVILMLWGYFKKLVIADRASLLVKGVVDSQQAYNSILTLSAFVFYCIQLYCDFSGGIDIVRGSSACFGINLAHNFRRPFFAVSLTDFWRRWHITLGSWMRDYVFYPLSLSKPFVKLGKLMRSTFKGKAGKILPVSIVTFIVYFLIGIWHGGSPKYIVFGIWNGGLITVSLLLEPLFQKAKKTLKINDKSLPCRIFAIARTNVLVFFGRYITRSATVSAALGFLAASFSGFDLNTFTNGAFLEFGLSVADYIIILLGVLLMLSAEYISELKDKELVSIVCKKPLAIYFCTLMLGIIVLVFGVFRADYISSEFIYKQF